MAAKQGICRLGVTRVQHGNGTCAMFIGVKNLFLNFTVQIEAMIFNVDEPSMGEKRIISAVLSKKENIEGMIQNTKAALQAGTFAPGLPWRADYNKLKPIIEKHKRRNPNLSFFKRVGEKRFDNNRQNIR